MTSNAANYADLSTDDLIAELEDAMFDQGVPPIDLTVALMGKGIDVQQLIDSMEARTDSYFRVGN